MLHLNPPTRPTLSSPLLAPRSDLHPPSRSHSPSSSLSPAFTLPSPGHLSPPARSPGSPARPRTLPALPAHARPPLPPLFALAIPRSPSPGLDSPNPFENSADPFDESTDEDSPLPSPLPGPGYFVASPPTTTPGLSPSLSGRSARSPTPVDHTNGRVTSDISPGRVPIHTSPDRPLPGAWAARTAQIYSHSRTISAPCSTRPINPAIIARRTPSLSTSSQTPLTHPSPKRSDIVQRETPAVTTSSFTPTSSPSHSTPVLSPFPSPPASRISTPPTPDPTPKPAAMAANNGAELRKRSRGTADLPDGADDQAGVISDRSAFSERYDIQYTPERATHQRNSRFGNVFLYILAVFLPPVPVFLKAGCGCEVLVNILLWALCWIPGVLHAFYIIASRP